MSAKVCVLVEFVNGKPSLALGRSGVSRSFTKRGSAENYAKQLGGDIRILEITIPDDGPVGEGMWPNLVPELSVNWS